MSDYETTIAALHAALGIAPDYAARSLLPLQRVPDHLVPTEPDRFDRPQQLTAAAFAAWTAMKSTAAGAGVEIFLVSAWRSPEYQHDLIARKLARGWRIEEILKVNAAPGYSEHHSGRAIDIGAPGCEVLSEDFETTSAFRWLREHAHGFGFRMSYPRGNPRGIAYEPWHWCYRGGKGQR